MQGYSAVSAGEAKRSQTRRIVVTGVLAAIAILLGVTRLGFIPVPTAAGNATIMHLPAVIGGVLEGPVVGGVIGLIFGLTSFFDATNPVFKDPLVAILPRIFIGIVAYLVYAGLRRVRVPAWVNLPITGFMGSATNTVLVLLMIWLRFHWRLPVILSVAVVNGLPEAVVSAIITTAVVGAYLGITRRNAKSKIS
ncbi:MAG: ECF transporter S component [Thermoflavifilum sp.]|nr:ECF transporter S component [Thermoflavifilum sp.]MCL6513846.1 ECF transporter S component [Alicyclobacillus sp.]